MVVGSTTSSVEHFTMGSNSTKNSVAPKKQQARQQQPRQQQPQQQQHPAQNHSNQKPQAVYPQPPQYGQQPVRHPQPQTGYCQPPGYQQQPAGYPQRPPGYQQQPVYYQPQVAMMGQQQQSSKVVVNQGGGVTVNSTSTSSQQAMVTPMWGMVPRQTYYPPVQPSYGYYRQPVPGVNPSQHFNPGPIAAVKKATTEAKSSSPAPNNNKTAVKKIKVSPCDAPTPNNVAKVTPVQSGTSTTKPVVISSTKPVGTSTIKPVGTSTTKPDGTSTTKPDVTSTTKPDGTSTTKSDGTSTTKPVSTSTIKDTTTNTSAPVASKKTAAEDTDTAFIGEKIAAGPQGTVQSAPKISTDEIAEIHHTDKCKMSDAASDKTTNIEGGPHKMAKNSAVEYFGLGGSNTFASHTSESVSVEYVTPVKAAFGNDSATLNLPSHSTGGSANKLLDSVQDITTLDTSAPVASEKTAAKDTDDDTVHNVDKKIDVGPLESVRPAAKILKNKEFFAPAVTHHYKSKMSDEATTATTKQQPNNLAAEYLYLEERHTSIEFDKMTSEPVPNVSAEYTTPVKAVLDETLANDSAAINLSLDFTDGSTNKPTDSVEQSTNISTKSVTRLEITDGSANKSMESVQDITNLSASVTIQPNQLSETQSSAAQVSPIFETKSSETGNNTAQEKEIREILSSKLENKTIETYKENQQSPNTIQKCTPPENQPDGDDLVVISLSETESTRNTTSPSTESANTTQT